MAVPTTWIRKNMLHLPTFDNIERQMSESELRVLRSIQKLSIPDWYLNNSSHPPKILSNDVPIDRRPSSWKNVPAAKTTKTTTIVQPNISTVCRDGVLETDIEVSNGNQRFATFKVNRLSSTKNSPSSSPSKEAPPKIPKMETIPSSSRISCASRTFPRVSPSRKIQNINIVFPQQESKCLQVTDLDETDDSVPDMTKDSLDSVSGDSLILGKNPDELDTGNASKGRGAKLASSCDTKFVSSLRVPPVVPPVASSKVRSLTSVKSDVDSAGEHRNPVAIAHKAVEDHKGPSKTISDRPRTYSSPKDSKISGQEAKKQPAIPHRSIVQQCDSCQCIPVRTKYPRATSGFRPKSVLPSIPEKSCTPPVLQSSTSSPLNSSKKSPKESSELEKIATTNQRPGKSLVSEIIKELNERCKVSSRPTYVSPTSKNFVKKLVTALENGVLPVPRIEDEQGTCEGQRIRNGGRDNNVHDDDRNDRNGNYNDHADDGNDRGGDRNDRGGDYNDRDERRSDDSEDDVFVASEFGSEDEVKSVAISTSISYKATDSSSSNSGSDTDLASPSIRYNDHPYCWDTNSKRNDRGAIINNNDRQENDKNDRFGSEVEEDDDWMYWNKRSEWNLPRTSSLLSIVSKSSSESASPCISPIDQSNDRVEFFSTPHSSTNTWATVYRTKKATVNGTRRLNETTILDSGYSDRSSPRSSPSSYIDNEYSAFDYAQTTENASENRASCFELSRNSMSSHKLQTNRTYGPPTFV